MSFHGLAVYFYMALTLRNENLTSFVLMRYFHGHNTHRAHDFDMPRCPLTKTQNANPLI